MTTTITISNRAGLSVRWYHNGWHYFTFPERYKVIESVRTTGKQVTERFSSISRVEVAVTKEVKRYIKAGSDQLSGQEFEGVKGMLSSNLIEVYLQDAWNEVEMQRSSQSTTTKGFQYTFEVDLKLDDDKINTY